jgi:hypothetical protein
MRLHLKEDPKEWRKAALLGLIGPTVIVSILRYKDIVSTTFLIVVLASLALVAICALTRPRWFRGYYRLMTRVGFYIIQFIGKIVLTVIFLVVLTPFGFILRILGKDFLELKSPQEKQTFWHKAKQDSSLDNMF